MAKIKIRKFLPSKVKGDIRTDPVASMTTQMNRLGFVVEDIGNMIVGMYEDKLDKIGDNKRKKTLSRDKSREDKLEKRRYKIKLRKSLVIQIRKQVLGYRSC